MVFSQEVLRLANNFSFLPSDHTGDSEKIFLVFAGKDCEYLLGSGTSLSTGGTFKNCPRKFAQLYRLHVDIVHRMKNTISGCLLSPDKKETTYHGLLTLLKSWSSF
jgi:hypothetical protein